MLSLCITGFDADPDEVTAILGLAPTSVGRTGERLPSGRLRDFNGWWLELRAARIVGGAEHHSAIEALLGKLEGKEARFATLRQRLRPKEITVYGAIYHRGEQCGVSLETHQMAALAACGVSWGLDIFTGEASIN